MTEVCAWHRIESVWYLFTWLYACMDQYGSGTDLVGHLRKSRQSCSPVISLPEVLRTSLGSTMQSIIAPYMPLSTSYLRSLATLRVFFTFSRPNRPLFSWLFLTTQPFWAGLICVLAFLKKKLLSRQLYHQTNCTLYRLNFSCCVCWAIQNWFLPSRCWDLDRRFFRCWY